MVVFAKETLNKSTRQSGGLAQSFLNIPRAFQSALVSTLVVLVCLLILFASDRISFVSELVNPHSEFGYIGILILSAAVFISFFVLLISVPKAVSELFRDLTLRTRFPIAVPVFGFLAWLLIAIWLANLVEIYLK
jgi:hypothetical protein